MNWIAGLQNPRVNARGFYHALDSDRKFSDNSIMALTLDQKTDAAPSASLNAIQFQALVQADRTIRVPDEVAARIPVGEGVRVLLLWEPSVEYSEWTDEEWAKLGAHMMAKGYEEDPVNENYDDLLKR